MIDYAKHRAHPTKYAGVQFRSRLEAKWAAFFTLCGVEWDYEPLDLQNWSPDFLVTLPEGPVLVEVKPIKAPDKDILQRMSDAVPWAEYRRAILVGLAPRKSLNPGLEDLRFWGWDIQCPSTSGKLNHDQVSDIHLPQSCWRRVGQLWDDACNVTQWRKPRV